MNDYDTMSVHELISEAYSDGIDAGKVPDHLEEIESALRRKVIEEEIGDFLNELAAKPAKEQDMMIREGFVIDNLDDRWQKLAFTLYADGIAHVASQALGLITEFMKSEEVSND